MDKQLARALRLLPKFAAGIYDPLAHKSVADLRGAAQFELTLCHEGENPLTKQQIKALERFLARTQ